MMIRHFKTQPWNCPECFKRYSVVWEKGSRTPKVRLTEGGEPQGCCDIELRKAIKTYTLLIY